MEIWLLCSQSCQLEQDQQFRLQEFLTRLKHLFVKTSPPCQPSFDFETRTSGGASASVRNCPEKRPRDTIRTGRLGERRRERVHVAIGSFHILVVLSTSHFGTFHCLPFFSCVFTMLVRACHYLTRAPSTQTNVHSLFD